MNPRLLLDHQTLSHTLDRLAFEIYERHGLLENIALVALQPRGIQFGSRIVERVKKFSGNEKIKYGELDITFYRDDFRRRDEVLIPSSTKLDFSIEGMGVVLIDDVLYTGRTVRSGLDALLDFGRPTSVELMVLIDRRFSRELPVQPDYVGKVVDVVDQEKVKVEFSDNYKNNQVILYNSTAKND